MDANLPTYCPVSNSTAANTALILVALAGDNVKMLRTVNSILDYLTEANQHDCIDKDTLAAYVQDLEDSLDDIMCQTIALTELHPKPHHNAKINN